MNRHNQEAIKRRFESGYNVGFLVQEINTAASFVMKYMKDTEDRQRLENFIKTFTQYKMMNNSETK